MPNPTIDAALNTPENRPETELENQQVQTGRNTAGPAEAKLPQAAATDLPEEIGGRKGLEPTRYGDWEKNGRCIDF